jgi:hypothetical protein
VGYLLAILQHLGSFGERFYFGREISARLLRGQDQFLTHHGALDVSLVPQCLIVRALSNRHGTIRIGHIREFLAFVFRRELERLIEMDLDIPQGYVRFLKLSSICLNTFKGLFLEVSARQLLNA